MIIAGTLLEQLILGILISFGIGQTAYPLKNLMLSQPPKTTVYVAGKIFHKALQCTL